MRLQGRRKRAQARHVADDAPQLNACSAMPCSPHRSIARPTGWPAACLWFGGVLVLGARMRRTRSRTAARALVLSSAHKHTQKRHGLVGEMLEVRAMAMSKLRWWIEDPAQMIVW